MTAKQSFWIRIGAWAVAAALVVAPGRAAAQDELESVCVQREGQGGECHLAAAAVRLIHPRVGVALWGGNPVPGSASTLGMRLGSVPRFSVSTRVVLVPVELPPLPDRSAGDGEGAILFGLSTQATVGMSPAPTVGGVLSLDGIARLTYSGLPEGDGFSDGGVWGWSAGLRIGALRESFTLPGVSLTLAYGRSGGVTFGDPAGGTDGSIDGAVSDLSATLAVGKRISALGLTAGVALDRYASDVDFGYRSSPLGPRVEGGAEARTDRWSGFVNASWTLLILHGSAELGWQESPTPGGLPADVTVDPVGWWAGLALRLSI
jgi:hypothetical protein